jgi:hypothetical protein
MGEACTWERLRNAYKKSVGKPEGKSLSGDLGVEGRALFKWILRK